MEALINRATSETNIAEDWATVLEICDLADSSVGEAESAIKILIKRLQHKNIGVQQSALKVSDAMAKNCNLQVQREIMSRCFLDVLQAKLAASSTHETIRNFILTTIQGWATDFGSTAQLGYVSDVYESLKAQNYQFREPETQINARPLPKSTLEQEEEDLQLAQALSLSESTARPTAELRSPAQKAPSQPSKLFTVKALYDFAAREEGELALKRGDIIDVWDANTYQSWWKGVSKNGEVGIFPSNYVQKVQDNDLGSDGSAASTPQFSAEQDSAKLQSDEALVTACISQIDEFRRLLTAVDPVKDSLFDHERLMQLHGEFVSMRPKIIKLIEDFKRRQNELQNLDATIDKVLNTHKVLCDQASMAAQQQHQYQVQPISYQPVYAQLPYQNQQPYVQFPVTGQPNLPGPYSNQVIGDPRVYPNRNQSD